MKRININYKPLDKSVNLRVVSGSLTQQYNATAREYVPDHALVPLVIQPDVYMTDPDGVIPGGLRNRSLTDIVWYENEVVDGKAITASNAYYTVDSSATDTRGRITIKRNIPEAEQLTLIFTARLTDTRTGFPVPVMGSAPLRVAQAIETATPRLLSSYPVGSRLYPTTGQRGLRIDCGLMAADMELSPAWRWQVHSGSAYRDLTEEDGVRGLGTSRLWVPGEMMDRQTRIRTIATLDGKAYVQDHALGVAYERYDTEIVVPGNGEVSPDMASVTVRARVWNNRGVIERPGRYFRLEWLDQDNGRLGEGETLEIARAKYAGAGLGVSLRVSEIYSGLVLGERAWVLDFRGREDTGIVVGAPGSLGFMASLKFGTNTATNTIEIVHDGKDGGLYVTEYVSGGETIYLMLIVSGDRLTVNVFRQVPGLLTVANVDGVPLRGGLNRLNFSCLKSDKFGFFGNINDVRHEGEEIPFYEADILPFNEDKALTITTRDSFFDYEETGISLRKLKAGMLTLGLETGSVRAEGLSGLTVSVLGAEESELLRQVTI